ncbi:MAG: Crp/Fnr family transcriptional regulator [Clostridia bacterium]|nr:Crp/Fnr family transcriptional regulator [Clostridia bacterium]
MPIQKILLAASPLFKNISGEKAEKLVHCLQGKMPVYEQDTILAEPGEAYPFFGLLLAGKMAYEEVDKSGNVRLLARVEIGDVFGEATVATERPMPCRLKAAAGTRVLLLRYDLLMGGCSNQCPEHVQLRKNFTGLLAEKLQLMTRKVHYLTIKSLRARMTAFLLDCKKQFGHNTFTLPYNQTALAVFLGANRSALSRTISQMCRDGLIETAGRSYKILNETALQEQLETIFAENRA